MRKRRVFIVLKLSLRQSARFTFKPEMTRDITQTWLSEIPIPSHRDVASNPTQAGRLAYRENRKCLYTTYIVARRVPVSRLGFR